MKFWHAGFIAACLSIPLNAQQLPRDQTRRSAAARAAGGRRHVIGAPRRHW